MILSVSSVASAAVGSALTAIASVSNMIFFFEIPYSAAVLKIFSAILTRPSAVSGIPSSSRVRATTTPPYFLTSGNISRITSAFPLTELIIAFPL